MGGKPSYADGKKHQKNSNKIRGKQNPCFISLSSKDFKAIDQQTMTTSITISSSDFYGHSVPTASVNDNEEIGYNLRCRKRAAEVPVESIRPPAKRQCALVRRMQSKPKLIVAPKEELRKGEVVLAQMRTYATWPARVLLLGKTFVNVYFYGDETTGNVPYEKVGYFVNNHELLKFNLKKTIDRYQKAVLSAERVMQIPNHLSIINQ